MTNGRMTNDRAIHLLESIAVDHPQDRYQEAINMAIESLKAPTGLISKQDVKWQIQEWINELNEAIDMLDSIPSADRPKNMIHIDEVYRLIAGHSNYHGDSILSAFTCLVEGKDVKPIAPLDESEEPEKTVYIPETKVIPTERSYVDLDEKVTATYYDVEHEEWTQKTVTIADVLDSVCDEYTILPSADTEEDVARRIATIIENEQDMRVILKNAEPLVLTCDGCRHVGTYDTDFPCSGCIRREKDYYEQER